MKRHLLICAILSAVVLLVVNGCKERVSDLYSGEVIRLKPGQGAEFAAQVKSEIAAEVADGFELTLWASEELVADPIAISMDEQGRLYYTQATRQSNSEFDVRSHPNWITPSISWQTVEDRRKFLRETFSETNKEGEEFLVDLNTDDTLDWRDLAVEKEQVWFVEDSAGTGFADRTQLYLHDFGEEVTDVANGIEVHDGDVFVVVGPDVWRTMDRNQNGIADKVTSISHGYAVHIGFSGHGMSGAKVGPDGRIWWGIGDIGANVIDQDGKHWKYPNQGVIARSEFDGSGFEIYAAGVRNTHEFVFDQYGNLISEDNDGDHSGERERLVYLINGSETGWRINWQFGKYTDPDNNTYKVWIDEKMHTPRWDGQAAYILPTIANYVNGPTGMVFNPGTALSETWANHFFISEFRGSPARSAVHAFTLKPSGASFELDSTQIVIDGMLVTGLDFGPEGALYLGDWIDGWGTKDSGRIWKLDVSDGADSDIRQSTMKLVQADLSTETEVNLGELLKHVDMRIRQKAQFELAKRGDDGLVVLLNAVKQADHQLARVHGVWGIGQLARSDDLSHANRLRAFLTDADPEIVTQAAKILGDVRYVDAGSDLIPLLEHESLRVQMHACEALGRMAHRPAMNPILDMLEANDDEDAWLRHAGMIALARLGDPTPLVAASTHKSRAVRIAAVVALRRMQEPEVAQFLRDEDELIAVEAARAINDDFSIPEALPDLARILNTTSFSHEALIRRAINANSRVGESENINILAEYAGNASAPHELRAEALATLGTWANPSVFDRVDGRYRGVVERDASEVTAAIQPLLVSLLDENVPEVLVAAIRACGKLEIRETVDPLTLMLTNSASADVRKAALEALYEMKADGLDRLLATALTDRKAQVRAAALELVPESGLREATAVALLGNIINTGTDQEKEAALEAVSRYTGPDAVAVLAASLNDLIAGKANLSTRLAIVEAVEAQNDRSLMTRLNEYQQEKLESDPLAYYEYALQGGNEKRGSHIFLHHPAGQCIRCHTIFEHGGTTGPMLAEVGKRLTRRQLLESIIEPSASFTSGYGVATVELEDGEKLTGIILEETNSVLKLKLGKTETRDIRVRDIVTKTDVPSAMPSMKNVLTRREVRDLIAFLKKLD